MIARSIADLLEILAAYAKARGVSVIRASTEVLGAGHRAESLRGGTDIGATKLERSLQYMSDNWPAGPTQWPIALPRPCRKSKPIPKKPRAPARKAAR